MAAVRRICMFFSISGMLRHLIGLASVGIAPSFTLLLLVQYVITDFLIVKLSGVYLWEE